VNFERNGGKLTIFAEELYIGGVKLEIPDGTSGI